MKLYTNKFPILKNSYYITPDNTLDEDLQILFKEGRIFKVLAMDSCYILLECEEKVINVSPDMLECSFEETDVLV